MLGTGVNATVVGSSVGSFESFGFSFNGFGVSVVSGFGTGVPSGVVPASDRSVTGVPVDPSGLMGVPVAVAMFSTPPADTSAEVMT